MRLGGGESQVDDPWCGCKGAHHYVQLTLRVILIVHRKQLVAHLNAHTTRISVGVDLDHRGATTGCVFKDKPEGLLHGD